LRQGASFPSFYGWISDGIFSSEEEIASYTFTDSTVPLNKYSLMQGLVMYVTGIYQDPMVNQTE
jgi:hypothetical protein